MFSAKEHDISVAIFRHGVTRRRAFCYGIDAFDRYPQTGALCT
jgi:hypothetical protein